MLIYSLIIFDKFTTIPIYNYIPQFADDKIIDTYKFSEDCAFKMQELRQNSRLSNLQNSLVTNNSNTSLSSDNYMGLLMNNEFMRGYGFYSNKHYKIVIVTSQIPPAAPLGPHNVGSNQTLSPRLDDIVHNNIQNILLRIDHFITRSLCNPMADLFLSQTQGFGTPRFNESVINLITNTQLLK